MKLGFVGLGPLAVMCALATASPAAAQDADPPTEPPPPASAAKDETATTGAAPEAAVPATPPAAPPGPPDPRSDSFDWVQFKNGEWLKGEIKEIQNDSFKFESDELDNLTLDLDDIQEIYSPNQNVVLLEDKTVLEGTMRVHGDDVTVATADGDVTVSRSDVRTVLPGERTEWNYWSGRLSFGGSFRSGNTDQTDIDFSFGLTRRGPGTRFNIDFTSTFSEVDGSTTTENQRLYATFDVFLTRRLFLRVPSFEYYRDRFQNIDFRLTPGVQVGYDVVDRDRVEWSVYGGLGYQYTQFVSVPVGADDTEGTAALLAGTRVTWEATSKLDVYFNFDLTVPVPETSRNSSRFETGLEYDVWGDLDLSFKVIWDRQGNLPPDDTGLSPSSNDVRMVVGVGWEF